MINDAWQVRDEIFAFVFGESVLNDAVAIVLARTLLQFNKPDADGGGEAVVGAFAVFCAIFIGSMLIGVVAGVLSSLAFKGLNLAAFHERQARSRRDLAEI